MNQTHQPFALVRLLFYLLVFLTPLVLTPFNYELFEFNKMLVVYLFTILISAAIAVEYIIHKKILVPSTPLDVPIFLYLLFQLVSAFLSIDPHISIYGYYGRFNGGLLSTICYIILYYSFIISFHEKINELTDKMSFGLKSFFHLFNFRKDRSILSSLPIQVSFNAPSLSYLGYAAFGSALLVTFYAFAQKFGIDAHLWVQDVQNRVFSTLGQPNWLAAYLVAMILISVSFALSGHRFRSRTAILISTLFYIALLFTKSRSGFLAFWICNTILVVIVLFKCGIINMKKRFLFLPFSTNEQRKSWLTNIVYLSILLVLLTFVINSPVSIPWMNRNSAIVEQPTGATALDDVSFNTTVTDSGDIRKIVWNGAWQAALARPYFGWGVETFAWIYYRFKPVEHNLTSEWDFLYNKAHNEYLNYAATSGFVGLGTYLLLLFIYLWWWLKTVIKKPLTTLSLLIISLGIAWISILITNFFGFSVVVTSLLFWLLPPLSFLLAKSALISTYSFAFTPFQSKIGMGIISFLGVYLIFSVATYWMADYYYAKGIALEGQDKYSNSYELLSRAVALRPKEPAYLNELSETSSILAYAYDAQKDATLAATLTKQAIETSNKALTISPLNVSFWKGRTRVFYNLSQINPTYLDQALQSIETAQTLAPTDPKIAYNHAILLNNVGDKKAAIEALERAIKMKPNYRDAAWALSLFYEEDKNIEKRDEWLNYILTNINPEDSEVKEKLGT